MKIKVCATYPNLGDTMIAVLQGKFIALRAFIKKLENSHTSNLKVHLKSLEKKGANTPKRNSWQEIVKLRIEINQLETKRTIQRINKAKAWFFEKINKIDKPLCKLKGREYPNQ